MRKKIFAILMSAMMMVSFMPAMAFAAAHDLQDDTKAPWNGFTVSNVAKGNVAVEHVSGDANPAGPAGAVAHMIYDGQTHEVVYNYTLGRSVAKSVVYSTFKKDANWKWQVIALNSAEAPTFKDAGTYLTIAGVTSIDLGTAGSGKVDAFIKTLDSKSYTRSLILHIYQRPVVVLGNGALNKKVVYNGKKVGLTDADFTILPCYNKKTGAFDLPLTGLCAGDTLFTKSLEVGPDAGTYPMTGFAAWIGINPNYTIFSKEYGKTTFGDVLGLKGKYAKTQLSLTSLLTNVTVTIEKADPTVKVTSNTLTIKRGKSKAVKFSTNFGTAKLTKLSGNAKITLKNGKLYVKKGLKKGTYKVKVKAAVANATNWNAASRTKTLTVKVK